MIKRYESCWGLSFPAIGRWKLEFWLAMPGYSIKPHTHAHEDIKLVLLFGHNIRFHRKKKGNFMSESFFARIWNIGRAFTINAGDEHSFDVAEWPLLFMNIEHWLCEPTSASDDLQLT